MHVCLQELAVPDLRQGTGQRAGEAAKASAAGKAPANAAPDESLVAPVEECSVCLNDFERPSITTCGHWFCRCAFSPSH